MVHQISPARRATRALTPAGARYITAEACLS